MPASTDDPERHHSPAVGDWPRGFDASWWPLLTVLGAAGVYAGVAMVLIDGGREPATGPRVLGGSLLLLLFSLGGWTYQGFVGETDGEATRAFEWGTALFLATEVATFGTGFAAYGYLHLRAWPPETLPALLSPFVLVNTVALVASSGTIHVAAAALERGLRRTFLSLLAATFGLGLLFLAGQAWEYYDFVTDGFVPTNGPFASVFFGLTGLHGFHVALGTGAIGVLLVRGLAGDYTPDSHTSVETVSLYWHFVDAVWLCLV
ncbi:MAG: heme-copper oxidase subunit III, partial [Halolamina sp.]